MAQPDSREPFSRGRASGRSRGELPERGTYDNPPGRFIPEPEAYGPGDAIDFAESFYRRPLQERFCRGRGIPLAGHETVNSPPNRYFPGVVSSDIGSLIRGQISRGRSVSLCPRLNPDNPPISIAQGEAEGTDNIVATAVSRPERPVRGSWGRGSPLQESDDDDLPIGSVSAVAENIEGTEELVQEFSIRGARRGLRFDNKGSYYVSREAEAMDIAGPSVPDFTGMYSRDEDEDGDNGSDSTDGCSRHSIRGARGGLRFDYEGPYYVSREAEAMDIAGPSVPDFTGMYSRDEDEDEDNGSDSTDGCSRHAIAGSIYAGDEDDEIDG